MLLPKSGRDPSSRSSYRLICRLDVDGKSFERIVASRIIAHLKNGDKRHDLSSYQFEFRTGRSTADALIRVRDLVQAALKKRGVAIAISIEERVKNALSSVPKRGDLDEP